MAQQFEKLFPDVPETHETQGDKPADKSSRVLLELWDGSLGKTVGGSHPDLFEEIDISAHRSKTHFARSMRAAAVKYEEHIGIDQPPPFHASWSAPGTPAR